MLGMIKDELGECCKKTDELCDAAKTLAGMGEGSAHRGWGGSCSALWELLQDELLEFLWTGSASSENKVACGFRSSQPVIPNLQIPKPALDM